MGNSRRVSNSPYRDLSVNCFNVHLSFQIARLDAKIMVPEFPKIKTQANHYRKLGMNAGKIPRDDSVEGAYDCQFPVIFLRKITECKEFYFNFTASPA